MKYIAFDKSAIEYIASTKEMQSIEFAEGKLFIDIIRGTVRGESTESLYINYSKTGLFFVLRESICITRLISSSRPITGSILSCIAKRVKSFAYFFRASKVPSGSADVTL